MDKGRNFSNSDPGINKSVLLKFVEEQIIHTDYTHKGIINKANYIFLKVKSVILENLIQ